MTLKLIGTDLSPFARKAIIVAREKGIEFEHDPMVPLGASEEHKQLHPQGKIPVLLHDDRVIPDSSVIAEYLEALVPEPALYPADPYLRARARWFEEFADSGLSQGALPYFSERVVNRIFMKQEPDEARIEDAATNILPPFFDYLERELGDDDYLVANRYSIADISVGTILVNYTLGQGEVDAACWPKLAAYVARVFARPTFKELLEGHHAALAAMTS